MRDVYCEVCEQRLPENTVYRAADFMGHTYFFCTLEDQEKFLADPDPYIRKDKRQQQQFSGTIEPQLSAGKR